jgi:hypothetical protein
VSRSCLTRRTPKEKVRSSRLNQQLSYQPRDEDVASLASESGFPEEITDLSPQPLQPTVELPPSPTRVRTPTPHGSPQTVPFVSIPDLSHELSETVMPRDVPSPKQAVFPPPVGNLLWSALDNLSPAQNTVSDLPVEDQEEFSLLSQALPGHIQPDSHDMANAPLVIRDAINAGARLVQYGLIGEVLTLR